MLRMAGPSISPQIDALVESLLREDADYDRIEQRSAHREHLVRCVEISLRDPEKNLWGFSRNISLTGIGLITQEEIPSGSNALLSIERLDGVCDKILASSRWSQPYGRAWHMSGWQFITVRN